MDKSLARGYTRMFINQMPTSDDIGRHFRGTRMKQVLRLVDEARHRKRDDRVLKQIKSILGPRFLSTELLRTPSRSVIGLSSVMSVSNGVGMMLDIEDEDPLFRERVLDFDRLVVKADDNETTGSMIPYASISMHAIQRLLQRDAIDVNKMEQELRKVLLISEHVALRLEDAGRGDELTNQSLMIPFRGGALLVAFVSMHMRQSEYVDEGVGYRICVRTFLSKSMLSGEDYERMEMLTPELNGLKLSQMRGPVFFRPEDSELDRERERLRWSLIFDQNAHPWVPLCEMAA